MPLDEVAAQAATQLKSSLASGTEVVSNFQELTFVQYVQVVLPLDGYVFWVRADQVSPTALLNAYRLNASPLNAGPSKKTPAPVIVAEGDLHYATTNTQDEATSYARNQVVFTSEDEVQDLNAVGSHVIYVAEVNGLKFTFSARGYFQQNADLFHYRGDAVYSDMTTQLVDDGAQLNVRDVVVSNSLPIWLAMNDYAQQDWELFGNPNLQLYPSFLLPNNLRPPYAAVHVYDTQVMTAAPVLDGRLSHFQLTREKVRITIFGQRNYNAVDFLDFVLQQSLNLGTFGIMNLPTLRDEKRTQVELNAIAMKKTIEFEINYYQTRLRDIARQLILKAVPTYYTADN